MARATTPPPMQELADPEQGINPLKLSEVNTPSYKTSELIALAILSTPNQRATTKQIYRWVSQNFAANAANEEVWQHRIRNGFE